MLVRCYGSRGSVPVSGKEYLKYGGDTTSIELRTDENDIILIDAGSGIRRLGNNLIKEKIKNVSLIFTHFHWDHILGFPFFRPIFFKDVTIRIYACSFNDKTSRELISNMMSHPYFPVKLDDCSAKMIFNENCNKPFRIGAVEIEQISLSHPNMGFGYKFTEAGKSFVFIPDNELSFLHPGGCKMDDYVQFCRDVDLLIHDAEYKKDEYKSKTTWGHSVFTDTLNLALDAGVKKFGLFHHNQERKDEEVDKIVNESKRIIDAQKSNLECFAVSNNFQICL